jgi:hypothetical protein
MTTVTLPHHRARLLIRELWRHRAHPKAQPVAGNRVRVSWPETVPVLIPGQKRRGATLCTYPGGPYPLETAECLASQLRGRGCRAAVSPAGNGFAVTWEEVDSADVEPQGSAA